MPNSVPLSAYDAMLSCAHIAAQESPPPPHPAIELLHGMPYPAIQYKQGIHGKSKAFLEAAIDNDIKLRVDKYLSHSSLSNSSLSHPSLSHSSLSSYRTASRNTLAGTTAEINIPLQTATAHAASLSSSISDIASDVMTFRSTRSSHLLLPVLPPSLSPSTTFKMCALLAASTNLANVTARTNFYATLPTNCAAILAGFNKNGMGTACEEHANLLAALAVDITAVTDRLPLSPNPLTAFLYDLTTLPRPPLPIPNASNTSCLLPSSPVGPASSARILAFLKHHLHTLAVTTFVLKAFLVAEVQENITALLTDEDDYATLATVDGVLRCYDNTLLHSTLRTIVTDEVFAAVLSIYTRAFSPHCIDFDEPHFRNDLSYTKIALLQHRLSRLTKAVHGAMAWQVPKLALARVAALHNRVVEALTRAVAGEDTEGSEGVCDQIRLLEGVKFGTALAELKQQLISLHVTKIKLEMDGWLSAIYAKPSELATTGWSTVSHIPADVLSIFEIQMSIAKEKLRSDKGDNGAGDNGAGDNGAYVFSVAAVCQSLRTHQSEWIKSLQNRPSLQFEDWLVVISDCCSLADNLPETTDTTDGPPKIRELILALSSVFTDDLMTALYHCVVAMLQPLMERENLHRECLFETLMEAEWEELTDNQVMRSILATMDDFWGDFRLATPNSDFLLGKGLRVASRELVKLLLSRVVLRCGKTEGARAELSTNPFAEAIRGSARLCADIDLGERFVKRIATGVLGGDRIRQSLETEWRAMTALGLLVQSGTRLLVELNRKDVDPGVIKGHVDCDLGPSVFDLENALRGNEKEGRTPDHLRLLALRLADDSMSLVEVDCAMTKVKRFLEFEEEKAGMQQGWVEYLGEYVATIGSSTDPGEAANSTEF